MLAPRRVGKTSLLFHLNDHPKPGWQCLFCSVEPAISETEFVARLLATILDQQPVGPWIRLKHKLQDLLGEVDHIKLGPFEITQRIGTRWQEVGTTIIHSIAKLDDKSLLLIDEFPIFIGHLLQQKDGAQRTEHFMSWFRDVRNDPNLPYGAVRFILTGSIGLDAVVKQARITSTINDLTPFSLEPLTPELADELLRKLAEGEGVPLDSELRSRILSRLSWLIPFHIQLYFQIFAQRVLFHQRRLSPSLVDEVYEELLSSERRPHFEHWLERMLHPLTSPEERDLQSAILESAARDSSGVHLDSVRQLRAKLAPGISEESVLLSLERDGYLLRTEDRWRFASLLLRDWWFKWVIKDST